jgi:hypothetical protein
LRRFHSLYQLHWDTYKRLVERRDIIAERLKQGRVRPIGRKIQTSESLEAKMIWLCLESDPPLHCRRTLDQFGYPNLRNTTARDDDQILYKRTKHDGIQSRKSAATMGTHSKAGGYSSKTEIKDGKVLMVDQLWLWMIDSETVTTFFPRKESSIAEGRLYQQADLRNSIYNEVNGDLTLRFENSMDFAALVVLHAVTVLLEGSSHPELQIFVIFEESISILVSPPSLKMNLSETLTNPY